MPYELISPSLNGEPYVPNWDKAKEFWWGKIPNPKTEVPSIDSVQHAWEKANDFIWGGFHRAKSEPQVPPPPPEE